MANGKFYGDGSGAMSYSPDRSRDVDRFNRSTASNYNYFDPYRQGYYSPRPMDTDGNRKPFPAADLFG
jgi:hypothetical protein